MIVLTHSEAQIDREAVRRRGLHEFMRRAYAQVEPGRFVDNWHLHVLAEYLEYCQQRIIRNLVIAIPPGTMKSLSVAVFYPVWCWILDPTEKFIYATYDQSLSETHARKARELIATPWFQERWGQNTEFGLHVPMSHARKVREYVNASRGFRFSTSPGGPSTGRHGTQEVFDDPVKVESTDSQETIRQKLEKADHFWTGPMVTRQAEPERNVRILMGQRTYDDDPSGRAIKTGDYEVLLFPMRFEKKRACRPSPELAQAMVARGRAPVADIRTEEGALLWPTRFPEVEVKKLEKSLAGEAHAQLQQDPVPPGGIIFNPAWLKNHWTRLPPEHECTWAISVDCRFKDSKSSGDYVVIQLWARYRGLFFLIDQVRGRWSFTATCAQLVAFSNKWPRAFAKLIEDKANGPAVVDALKLQIPGLILVEPEGGKEARANAVTPIFESGNVLTPEPSTTDWMLHGVDGTYGWLAEHERFPRAPFDDQVDTTTQALVWMANKSLMLEEAMARLEADPSLSRQLAQLG